MSVDSTSPPARTAVAATHGAAAASAAPRAHRPPWLTLVPLACLLTLSTAFWLEALQGAAGYIGRSQHPFVAFLRDATLLLPLLVLTVLGVWTIARHRCRDLSAVRPVLMTGLALAAAATVVGVAALIANAAYDYHLQSDHLRLAEAQHSTAVAGGTTHDGHPVGAGDAAACTGACFSQQRTLQTHIRGVELTSGLVLGSNLLLTAWVIALSGGRLDTPADRTSRGTRARPAAG